ncbi:MAG: hypothetical protein ABIS17_14255 [Casimicrobiaceae bacterium]
MNRIVIAFALASLAGTVIPAMAQSPATYGSQPGSGYGAPSGSMDGTRGGRYAPPPSTPYGATGPAYGNAQPGTGPGSQSGYPAPGGAGGATTAGIPPALPALSPEQSANLNAEMTRYREWVDGRLARSEINAEEAQRLVEWRRWQLARQIAGLAAAEPRVVVHREYVYPAVYPAYDPWYRPYDPWYRPHYYAPRAYFGPRLSICAGGWGRHSFGSLCF